MTGEGSIQVTCLCELNEVEEIMDFRVHDWIENKAYGNGQIIGDGETFWLIRFINHGEKKMLKGFIEHEGQPPYPSFAIPKGRDFQIGNSLPEEGEIGEPGFRPSLQEVPHKVPRRA